MRREQAAFSQSIEGGGDSDALKRVASVIINRLIFAYFIQKRGFLDNNPDYLRSKLNESRRRGKNLFYSDFLLHFFYEGLAKSEDERAPSTNIIPGKIPFLGGSLFISLSTEAVKASEILIADEAFEKLFDFLDGYRWRADEGAILRNDEINTNVLGYIFEQQVNQKQMGAYYTKEDITEYIAGRVIIPFLFDRAREACSSAFEGNGDVWGLLQADPARYLYDAVKKGASLNLPDKIVEGSSSGANRAELNKPASGEYGLRTETWREVIARRNQYEITIEQLASGIVKTVNETISYNLDIRKFARDVIEKCNDARLLAAIWQSLETVTVLDPTCGSGAFLFAAINILEPLYEACLDRMRHFVKAGNYHSTLVAEFRKITARASTGAGQRLFVLKTIIANNLFGVDLVEEAVEICKMRLLLKLIAQAESVDQLEMLAKVEINLRTGNALVGKVDMSEQGVAGENGFHWPAEFPSAISRGGFDCIIGNPPYISALKARNEYSVSGYKTARCSDVYAWVLERSTRLLKADGRIGMIVPLSITFSSDFTDCRSLLFERYGASWFSSFARIPSALFNFDVRVRNTIFIAHKSEGVKQAHTSRLHRWFETARPHLFETIQYAEFNAERWNNRIPKLNTTRLARAFERCLAGEPVTIKASLSQSATHHALHFKRSAYNWLSFCRALPPCYDSAGQLTAQTKFSTVYFRDERTRDLAFVFLNGKIQFAFWCIVGDDFDLTQWMFADFPFDLASIPPDESRLLAGLAGELQEAMDDNLSFKLNAGKRVGNYNLARCRTVTDKSDQVFARLLGIEDAWEDIELLYAQIVKTNFCDE